MKVVALGELSIPFDTTLITRHIEKGKARFAAFLSILKMETSGSCMLSAEDLRGSQHLSELFVKSAREVRIFYKFHFFNRWLSCLATKLDTE